MDSPTRPSGTAHFYLLALFLVFGLYGCTGELETSPSGVSPSSVRDLSQRGSSGKGGDAGTASDISGQGAGHSGADGTTDPPPRERDAQERRRDSDAGSPEDARGQADASKCTDCEDANTICPNGYAPPQDPSCSTENACRVGRLERDEDTCREVCIFETIDICQSGDGCCPSGCEDDADCEAVCDNGMIESGELCDPIASCPMECDDGDSCTQDVLSGAADQCRSMCEYRPITQCQGGDGCCPATCNANNDSDCRIDCRDINAWPQAWAQLEEAVFQRINAERNEMMQRCGGRSFPAVSPLTMNDDLRIAARCHSQDMALRSFFAHSNPSGETPGERVTDLGYRYSTVGENIAAGQSSAEDVMDGWMLSPGHCSNIMKDSYTEVGVGYYFRRPDPERYQHYWTQVFARPR